MKNIRIDECMDFLDPSFLTEIEMEEIVLNKQQQMSIEKKALQKIGARPKKWTKRGLAVCLAATVAVSALTLAAAAAFRLDPAFQNFFGAQGEDGMALLNAAGGDAVASDLKGGYQMEVKGVVGDQYSFHVLLELTAPEGEVVNEYYRFDTAYLWVEKQEIASMGWHVNQIDDGNPTDNKASFVLSGSADQSLSGEKVSLTLGNLTDDSLPSEDPEYFGRLLEKGEWKLDFTLNYKNTSKVYKVNEKFDYCGVETTLQSMILSPLSISFEVKGPEDMEELEMSHGTNLLMDESGEYPVSIQLKDGTVVREFSGGGASIEGQKGVATIQFAKIIDPKDIQSVTYRGMVVPVSK